MFRFNALSSHGPVARGELQNRVDIAENNTPPNAFIRVDTRLRFTRRPERFRPRFENAFFSVLTVVVFRILFYSRTRYDRHGRCIRQQ